MSVDDEKDLEGLRKIGKIVSSVLKEMRRAAQPGMTTKELDQIGEALLKSHGAQSAPKVTYKFPGSTCISVNHQAAHGIPGKLILREGDLINIDVSAELGGYFADTGASFVLPPASTELENLCSATFEALEAAVKVVRAGRPLNAIGKAIENYANQHGYSIIRNLCSHGVGRSLHEEPKEILSFYDPNDKRIIEDGMVFTIEPFLSTGASFVVQNKDGWTLETDKKYRTAQFEHTLIATKAEPILVTSF